MKKIRSIVLPAILLGAGVMVSCQKEMKDNAPLPEYRYEIVGGNDEAKISLKDPEGSRYAAVWEENDEISIYSASGAEFYGNAALASGAGEGQGKFILTTPAAPGTRVRAIYPVMDGFGNGILPCSQTYNASKPSDIHYLTYAYSDEFTLSASPESSFTLHHTMAIVKIRFSCTDLPGNATLKRVILRSPEKPVSGGFKVDYTTGKVNASSTCLDYVELGFNGKYPVICATENSVMMAVLPSAATEKWCVNLEFECSGTTYSIPARFKAEMKGGQVNVINLTGLSISSAFKPTTIFLAGDSTCAVYGVGKDNIRGWGQMLHYFYESPFIKVDDRAIGGRSTKTFRSEGDWDRLLSSLKAGDHVIIQFGHNDENNDKTESGRGTYPQQYYDNLVQFVLDVRAKDAEPIFATPILRRRFHNGEATDDYGGNWTHKYYAPKMHRIADSLNVNLIDALEESRNWLNSLGAEEAKNYYHWFNAGDYPQSSTPEGNNDDTHLNQRGAYEIAKRISRCLNGIHPEFHPQCIAVPYSVIERDLGPIKIYKPRPANGEAGDMGGNDIPMVTD